MNVPDAVGASLLQTTITVLVPEDGSRRPSGESWHGSLAVGYSGPNRSNFRQQAVRRFEETTKVAHAARANRAAPPTVLRERSACCGLPRNTNKFA